MDDLDKYIEVRKKKSPSFGKNFDKGYEQFKIGVLLKQARLEAGLTQEEVASKLKTNPHPHMGFTKGRLVLYSFLELMVLGRLRFFFGRSLPG